MNTNQINPGSVLIPDENRVILDDQLSKLIPVCAINGPGFDEPQPAPEPENMLEESLAPADVPMNKTYFEDESEQEQGQGQEMKNVNIDKRNLNNDKIKSMNITGIKPSPKRLVIPYPDMTTWLILILIIGIALLVNYLK